jgi:uroporphyrinogen-III decarboxylase
MNFREQILRILSGNSPDQIPWIPRLQIWYKAHQRMGTLPKKYQASNLQEIELDLGVGTPARDGRIFRTQLHGVEVHLQERENETLTEYITPYGKVSTLYKQSKELERIGIIGQEIQHIIKRPEDYPAVEYIIEHTEVIPTYEEYLAYENMIGSSGLPIISIGQDPMNQILQELIGYNQAYYHLNDYPEKIAHLLEVLEEKAAQIQQVVLESPALLINYGEHFDSQMTPPSIFTKYMLPHFQSFAERLHQRGKYLACHADADSSHLLDLINYAGFDLAECFVTAPMVPVTLEQARSAWGSDVIIWGGIPSILLCDSYSDEEFEKYMQNLFRVIAPGDGFILGVADNVMPETRFDRILRISEMVAAYGEYPICTENLL